MCDGIVKGYRVRNKRQKAGLLVQLAYAEIAPESMYRDVVNLSKGQGTA